MSRAVHLSICHQSGLAPECVSFSLLPLSCSSCLPEKFLRLVPIVWVLFTWALFPPFALCWIYVATMEAELALGYGLSEEHRLPC